MHALLRRLETVLLVCLLTLVPGFARAEQPMPGATPRGPMAASTPLGGASRPGLTPVARTSSLPDANGPRTNATPRVAPAAAESAPPSTRSAGHVVTGSAPVPGRTPPTPSSVSPRVDPPLRDADRTTLRANATFSFALGVSRNPDHAGARDGSQVQRFAGKVGAMSYGDVYGNWNPRGGLPQLQKNIYSAMVSATKIRFNLDGFDVRAFQRAVGDKSKSGLAEKMEYGKITNWELKTILSDPGLLAKTTFYAKGGREVPAPSLSRSSSVSTDGAQKPHGHGHGTS